MLWNLHYHRTIIKEMEYVHTLDKGRKYFFFKELLSYSAFHSVLNTKYLYKGKICIYCKRCG